MSSGEHSLAGTELAGTTLFSDKDFPPVRGCSAGGEHPKRSSPPTTAASPDFGRREIDVLRRTFARRNCDRWHNSLLRQELSSGQGVLCRRKHPKRRSPPTTAASPHYSRPQCNVLRRTVACRRRASRHHHHFR